jgi:hypothetical protein
MELLEHSQLTHYRKTPTLVGQNGKMHVFNTPSGSLDEEKFGNYEPYSSNFQKQIVRKKKKSNV